MHDPWTAVPLPPRREPVAGADVAGVSQEPLRRGTAPTNQGNGHAPRFGADGVEADVERHPQLFLRLAENALTVAESVRDNYLRNTARFVADLRRAVRRPDPLLAIGNVGDVDWSQLQGEVVTFIDGGVGQVQVSSQAPILLRVGSYSVRTGDRRLAERERFGYYPIILGDLEGGSRDRANFADLVRVTAELLGGLSALERTPDLRVLMFHGPLLGVIGGFAGHTPFTEPDIDLFLRQYGTDSDRGRQMKEEFLAEAEARIYPRMNQHHAAAWVRRRLFEPLAWIAFLQRRLIREARRRSPIPIIAGVVERGHSSEFNEQVLFERVFDRLHQSDTADYFNRIFGRRDLTSPRALTEKLGYADPMLLALLLQPGEFTEPWETTKRFDLGSGTMSLPGGSRTVSVDWEPLTPPSSIGFPAVCASYVHVSPTTEPIRVEVFADLGPDQPVEAVRRAYLYARLLPGYGFPVGLDIVDKHAHVPAWLTKAYGKLIHHHLSASLQRGEITDAELQRLLVQAVYTTHRHWLLRPDNPHR